MGNSIDPAEEMSVLREMRQLDTAAAQDGTPFPQAGYERLVAPIPIAAIGTDMAAAEQALLTRLGRGAVWMMGDDPALPRMPAKPQLIDFFRLRFGGVTYRHLLHSAKRALDARHEEKVVMACLLHDIANCALIRSDHGYWSAQLVEPYVDEEIAWAVRYHQALRYFPDESVGYAYPEAYVRYFGSDFEPPEYLKRDHEMARAHRWYMTSRLITLNDIYAFDESDALEPEMFTDIIGRHFHQPEEGLGFDNSPVTHMWRSMIWPHNFL